ncbi:MAG: ribosome biogenesis GTP-binding protein YihA/YsxC [Clostridiales bacterium]|nr:ribosome biogenesis GTP-binding protein YihA/YsxC [Clostridiales bacterium]MDY5726647.1 ribosome biogenesis GTP-binding protein YihA/YsxC [Eubacteriales bacterium]
MKISYAEFLSSAARPKDKIKSDLPQIAVVGKSNVGKSSFINYFAHDGKLARVSKQPGRTKMINYFLINREFILADLPGYGFARVSQEEKRRWAELIDDYLANEPDICLVIFLVDIRHDPTQDDMIMYNFLFKTGLPFIVVATKADKLSKSQIKPQLARIANIFKLGVDNVLAISNENKTGMDAVYAKIEQALAYSSQSDADEEELITD